ncbi:ChbG/HpnK family deacetylase [Massilia sp. W12]|uniref:ChbG/HpnK family deacetylase n=1 Tax=Massilia sp. W12 TaxID=3126507 RepID=UPI0030D317CB
MIEQQETKPERSAKNDAALPEAPPHYSPLVLCADDFGQHVGIDAAVILLLSKNRLSAVSCMSNAPRWRAMAAPALLELRSKVQGQRSFDVGLHFNLTEGFGYPPAWSLRAILLQSHVHLLAPERLQQSWHAQLDGFERAMRAAPDFIDGHQHVHQLPQVREAMLKVMQERYGASRLPWVRNTMRAARSESGKARLLEWLGGAKLSRRLRQQGIESNQGFGGVYGFDAPNAQAYASLFGQWLQQSHAGGLIMCHPAAAKNADDPISSQRLVEYAFLTSSEFPQLLTQHHRRLSRLRDS